MNTDEKFNFYSEQMEKINPARVKTFENCLSDMLANKVSSVLVWEYAEQEIKIERLKKENPKEYQKFLRKRMREIKNRLDRM